MSNTQIKRLYQTDKEFVPITLAEAVVVNSSKLGLSSLGITTLDKVLKSVIGITGTNAADIDTLEQAVKTINTTLGNKLDKLSAANAGVGIQITEQDGVLKISATNTVELYKVVAELPRDPSTAQQNTIYLVPSSKGVSGNKFLEYISVKKGGQYSWEQIGSVQTEVNLEGYVTTEQYNKDKAIIDAALKNSITAKNVTTSLGYKVAVDYTIPKDLYDKLVIDSQNHIVQI